MFLTISTIFNQHLKGRIFLYLSLTGVTISLVNLGHFFIKEKTSALEWSIETQALIFTSMAIYLLAAIIRAYNYKKLIEPIKIISLFQSFKYLSVGSLFNTLLPFRLGEIIRAHITGKNIAINRSAILFTIVIERLVDSTILTSLILVASTQYFSSVKNILLYLLIILIFLTLSIVLLVTENIYFLKSVFYLTELFNNRLKNTIRFSIWSIIYTARKLLTPFSVIRYTLTSINMWSLYLVATYLITKHSLASSNLIAAIYSSVLPYISSAIPSGPGYVGTYHIFYLEHIRGIALNSNLFQLSLVTWSLMIIPITSIGLIFLFTQTKIEKLVLETFFDNSASQHQKQEAEKLSETKYFSEELGEFLGNYFSGLKLAQVLNNDELKSNIRILKIFKGGSNAITALIWKNGQVLVRKTTLSQYASKLISQHDWLAKRQIHDNIPKIISSDKNETSYTVDIQYYQDFSTFFDYIHSHPISQSIGLLESILAYADKYIYTNPKSISSPENLNRYIDSKIVAKVLDTAKTHLPLQQLVSKYNQITLNGIIYDNFNIIIEKIKKNSSILSFLSKYEHTDIHGDLTVDNILARDSGFILLDPLDENFISDKVVDYGKLYQSFHSGYEFLVSLNSIEYDQNHILYKNEISKQYTQLFEYLEKRFQKDPSPNNRYLQIKFHEAVHYFRMLPYKAQINPQTLPLFYAIAIKLLNEFYQEYNYQMASKK